MARMRTLKPGFFTNDVLGELPPLARLLFQGLWCLADRAGRLEDRPKRIKAEVLPYDDANVDELLDALAEHGFIQRYGVDGQALIQVANFGKHQSPHIKEPSSVLPGPPREKEAPGEHGASTVPAPDEQPASTPRNFNRNREQEQFRGTGGSGGAEASTEPPAAVPDTPQVGSRAEKAAGSEAPAPLHPVPKRPPPTADLGPLLEAFAERGLPQPNIGPLDERDAAATLLRGYPPAEIATCWQEIAAGDYGGHLDQQNLSFAWLAKNNRVGNWKRLREQDAPTRGRRAANGPPRISAGGFARDHL